LWRTVPGSAGRRPRRYPLISPCSDFVRCVLRASVLSTASPCADRLPRSRDGRRRRHERTGPASNCLPPTIRVPGLRGGSDALPNYEGARPRAGGHPRGGSRLLDLSPLPCPACGSRIAADHTGGGAAAADIAIPPRGP
jgi:hypothetical protein